MQNFQKLTFSIISILIFSCSSEKLDTPFEITSPNNSLSAVVSIDEGVPYYSLSFNGTLVVDKSRLGINTDKFLLSDQLQVIKSKRRSQNKSWNQVWGEQKIIQDNHNELELTLLSIPENHKMILYDHQGMVYLLLLHKTYLSNLPVEKALPILKCSQHP